MTRACVRAAKSAIRGGSCHHGPGPMPTIRNRRFHSLHTFEEPARNRRMDCRAWEVSALAAGRRSHDSRSRSGRTRSPGPLLAGGWPPSAPRRGTVRRQAIVFQCSGPRRCDARRRHMALYDRMSRTRRNVARRKRVNDAGRVHHCGTAPLLIPSRPDRILLGASGRRRARASG